MTMGKGRKTVRVRVRTSFNGLRRGEVSNAVMDARLKSWIEAGLIEVIEGGTDPAGPGAAEPDDGESVPGGAEGGVPSGGEPGQGFGAGAYGTSESVDQS